MNKQIITQGQKALETNIPVMLITGFGPFDTFNKNPSADVIKILDGKVFSNIKIAVSEIDVTWEDSWKDIQAAIDLHKPVCVLLLGLAHEYSVRLENTAVNYTELTLDVNDKYPVENHGFIIEDAPESYPTTLPTEWLLDEFREYEETIHQSEHSNLSFVHARQSNDAGTYICNYVFYQAMHYLEEQVPYRGFVHIPSYSFLHKGEGNEYNNIFDSVIFLVQKLAQWVDEKVAKTVA